MGSDAQVGKLGKRLNLARIELTSLHLVVLCTESGSLSCAAPRAHLSLSGASHRLSRLEDSLGVRLFIRHHRGLEPTAAGKLLALRARQVLDMLERLPRELRRAPFLMESRNLLSDCTQFTEQASTAP